MKNFLQHHKKYIFIGMFVVVGRLLRHRWAVREWEKAQHTFGIVLGALFGLLFVGICVGLLASVW